MFSKKVIQDTHTKTLAKTITYRIVSTIINILLTPTFGGNTLQAITMGGLMMSTAVIHYYLYDRLWLYIPWQRSAAGDDSRTRTLIKSVIYRMSALLVTAAIARMVFADTNLVAIMMASVKFVVNLAAYYGVERLFNWWRWGRKSYMS